MTRKEVLALLEEAQDSVFDSNPTLWQKIQDLLQAEKKPIEWNVSLDGDQHALVNNFHVTVRSFGNEATWHVSSMDRAPTIENAKEIALGRI